MPGEFNNPEMREIGALEVFVLNDKKTANLISKILLGSSKFDFISHIKVGEAYWKYEDRTSQN